MVYLLYTVIVSYFIVWYYIRYDIWYDMIWWYYMYCTVDR